MNLTLFCEDCGCNLELADKFCTGCGVSLGRTREKVSVQLDLAASIGDPYQSKATVTSHQVEAPKPAQPIQQSQQIMQSQPDVAAAPKSSLLKIAFISVFLLAVGATGALFVTKGGLFKDAPKPSSDKASQKQGTAGKSPPEVIITGQMLIESSIKGNFDEFQGLLQQMKSRSPAATIDRKQARALNDDAIKAIRAQDYAGAIDLLNKARTADLGDAEISNNLGYAMRLAEDFKASESQLVKTIEQFPTRQQAWSDLGETSSKLGKHPQAVSAFVTGHRLAKNPEKLLERYLKLAESTEDEALKGDLTEAVQIITGAK